MSNQQILGVCGLLAAIIGTASGVVGAKRPRVGHIMSGAASAIMLFANLVLIFRRDL
jgi:hypothetical protein